MGNETYTHQFRTLDDLREIIKEFQGFLARPTVNSCHPTLYAEEDVPSGDELVQGVRVKDWLLSPDRQWVLPDSQMGLSFSSSWQHLKGVCKLKQRHNPGAAIHVYWVLEEADVPDGLKFEPDSQKKGHYLLTATKKMLIHQLVEKLTWVADRMSVIRDAGETL